MNDTDRLQEINVDFSQFIKKNLKKIKALPADKQKQFGKLLGDFKNGLDDLSEGINESLSPEVAKHMGSIHKGFKKVEDDGVMVYDSPATAKKASDFLNSKKIAASFDGKYVYLESVNEAKIAFINDTLILDRIKKSGLLPLLGDNNTTLNSDKVKFTRALGDTLKKLYKNHSSLPVK